MAIYSTYASTAQANYLAGNGYMGADPSKGWRPKTNDNTPYLNFVFSLLTFVTSIEMKGANGTKHYVKSFTIRYLNQTSGRWVSEIRPFITAYFGHLPHVGSSDPFIEIKNQSI